MSPRARDAGTQIQRTPEGAQPILTVALPTEIHHHVHAPAPALVTRRNADHLGMSGDEFVRVLRAMRADPRFRHRVIAQGKSFRGAAPADVIAFLRAAPPSVEGEEDDGLDHDLLRRAGYEVKPRVAAASAARASR